MPGRNNKGKQPAGFANLAALQRAGSVLLGRFEQLNRSANDGGITNLIRLAEDVAGYASKGTAFLASPAYLLRQFQKGQKDAVLNTIAWFRENLTQLIQFVGSATLKQAFAPGVEQEHVDEIYEYKNNASTRLNYLIALKRKIDNYTSSEEVADGVAEDLLVEADALVQQSYAYLQGDVKETNYSAISLAEVQAELQAKVQVLLVETDKLLVDDRRSETKTQLANKAEMIRQYFDNIPARQQIKEHLLVAFRSLGGAIQSNDAPISADFLTSFSQQCVELAQIVINQQVEAGLSAAGIDALNMEVGGFFRFVQSKNLMSLLTPEQTHEVQSNIAIAQARLEQFVFQEKPLVTLTGREQIVEALRILGVQANTSDDLKVDIFWRNVATAVSDWAGEELKTLHREPRADDARVRAKSFFAPTPPDGSETSSLDRVALSADLNEITRQVRALQIVLGGCDHEGVHAFIGDKQTKFKESLSVPHRVLADKKVVLEKAHRPLPEADQYHFTPDSRVDWVEVGNETAEQKLKLDVIEAKYTLLSDAIAYPNTKTVSSAEVVRIRRLLGEFRALVFDSTLEKLAVVNDLENPNSWVKKFMALKTLWGKQEEVLAKAESKAETKKLQENRPHPRQAAVQPIELVEISETDQSRINALKEKEYVDDFIIEMAEKLAQLDLLSQVDKRCDEFPNQDFSKMAIKVFSQWVATKLVNLQNKTLFSNANTLVLLQKFVHDMHHIHISFRDGYKSRQDAQAIADVQKTLNAVFNALEVSLAVDTESKFLELLGDAQVLQKRAGKIQVKLIPVTNQAPVASTAPAIVQPQSLSPLDQKIADMRALVTNDVNNKPRYKELLNEIAHLASGRLSPENKLKIRDFLREQVNNPLIDHHRDWYGVGETNTRSTFNALLNSASEFAVQYDTADALLQAINVIQQAAYVAIQNLPQLADDASKRDIRTHNEAISALLKSYKAELVATVEVNQDLLDRLASPQDTAGNEKEQNVKVADHGKLLAIKVALDHPATNKAATSRASSPRTSGVGVEEADHNNAVPDHSAVSALSKKSTSKGKAKNKPPVLKAVEIKPPQNLLDAQRVRLKHPGVIGFFGSLSPTASRKQVDNVLEKPLRTMKGRSS